MISFKIILQAGTGEIKVIKFLIRAYSVEISDLSFDSDFLFLL